MSSTFFGMQIGSQALNAAEMALNVAGQNLANVSTPGYTRQVVNLEATEPYTSSSVSPGAPGQIGTGVEVASISQVRDQYLDQQVNNASSQQSSSASLSNLLGQVQDAFGEPSTTALSGQLSNFYNSFSSLSVNPESTAERSTVVDQAHQLVNTFQSTSASLAQIAPQANAQATSDIATVNQIAGQIAKLNAQIAGAVANNEQPNDLNDQRGALVAQLSGLVNVQVTNLTDPNSNQPSGEIQVNVGGYSLVSGVQAGQLPTTTTTTAANGQIGLVSSDGTIIPLQSGEVFGLLQATQKIAGYQAGLNTVAANIISSVNALNEEGYGLDGSTGNAFFTGTNAADIQISQTIQNNPDAIAAASAPAAGTAPAPGNGDNATAIANLANAPTINGQSVGAYYAAQIAQIGSDTQGAQAQQTNQSAVVTQLQNQQSSISGVSMDQELTNLLEYQRSYQAAAQLISIQDTMLGTIIDTIGAAVTTT